MPNRWPISSGNWSDSAIWSGSIIPTASDDVYSNGKVVNIDTNVSFTTLRNDASASAVVAGGFFIPNDGITMTGNILGSYGISATNEYVVRCTGSNSSTLIGNITTNGFNFMVAVSMANGSSLTVTGSVQCSNRTSGGFGTTNRAILMASTGSLLITGSVSAGSGGNGIGTIHATAAGTIQIIGNITSLAGSQPGPVIFVQGNPNITIQGDVISSVSIPININTGTSTLTITGSIYSVGTIATVIINIGGTSCNVNISGSIISGPNTIALQHTTAGTSNLIGPIFASYTFPGVTFSNASHILSATGPFYNSNSRNAVNSINLQLLSGSTPTWTFDTETYAEQRTLYTLDYPGNFPSSTNVRDGIIFGDTNQFTGTVAIPSTGSVLKGVPVDNTTGSASFDIQNAWNADINNLTTTGSLGARLKNVATVATTGDAIASKGNL